MQNVSIVSYRTGTCSMSFSNTGRCDLATTLVDYHDVLFGMMGSTT
jgi:hypothetical protein